MLYSIRKTIAKCLVLILLFNITTPAFASLVAPTDKILICSQNGFEWVSIQNQEQAYLKLATQLKLDIDSLFPDLKTQQKNVAEQPDSPHGKCVLCFFEEASGHTASPHKFALYIQSPQNNDYAPELNFVAQKPPFQTPILRAPPVFV